MAVSPRLKAQAQRCFVADGWSQAEIVRELGVPRATLRRWVKAGWGAQRARAVELERRAGDLLMDMLDAASESRDPQQAYAAVSAAKLGGLLQREPAGPSVTQIAEALLDALVEDAELGPLVRKRSAAIAAAVSRRVSELQKREGLL